jgi:hypothetical protein
MSGCGNPRADSPGISGRESDLLMEAEMVDRKRIGAGLSKRYDGELAMLVCEPKIFHAQSIQSFS